VTHDDDSSAETDGSFALDDGSWQEEPMSLPHDRLLLHLARDRRRAIDPRDVYFLEATGETTLVRLRSARRVRDTRALGELLPLLAAFGSSARTETTRSTCATCARSGGARAKPTGRFGSSRR
jgi:hypothetical protein